jgi:hypothetical protein
MNIMSLDAAERFALAFCGRLRDDERPSMAAGTVRGRLDRFEGLPGVIRIENVPRAGRGGMGGRGPYAEDGGAPGLRPRGRA